MSCWGSAAGKKQSSELMVLGQNPLLPTHVLWHAGSCTPTVINKIFLKTQSVCVKAITVPSTPQTINVSYYLKTKQHYLGLSLGFTHDRWHWSLGYIPTLHYWTDAHSAIWLNTKLPTLAQWVLIATPTPPVQQHWEIKGNAVHRWQHSMWSGSFLHCDHIVHKQHAGGQAAWSFWQKIMNDKSQGNTKLTLLSSLSEHTQPDVATVPDEENRFLAFARNFLGLLSVVQNC